ncbi:MAG TPA: sugar ABC transporter permease, partial [Fibrobacteres bacterium]|nr:sugar ABC transporter permease [Fibrobacterota bacterium]
MNHSRKHISSLSATAALAFLCVIFAYPFVWMFCSGFKTDAEVFALFPLLPQHFDLVHYRGLLSGAWIPYPRLFLNSLFIASLETIFATAFACGAGYVFAKFDFRFKKTLFILAVAAVLVPRQALALPLFVWMNKLSLLDTPWSVILPGTASGVGFLYFIAVFRRLPDPLLDMARCEGAGEYRVFLSTLPLIKPALIAFALIQFVLCWQEHLIPLIMLSTQTHLTVTLGLA